MPELTFDQWIQVINIVVLAVTAAIVAWYTLETKWLKQEAQDQTKTLTDQLDQLRQEVEIQRSQLEIERERHRTEQSHELERQARAVDPQLEFDNAKPVSGGFQIWFINKGGRIRDISARLADEATEAQVELSDNEELETGETAFIVIKGEDKNKSFELRRKPFILEYTNEYGEPRSKTFRFDGGQYIEEF